ncbi:MAG: FkbM family methyltransferase [Solirubrobacterales bacterium]|nr:FkbM family methyltransferase [Solirubrobacterales bacterium]
MTSPTAKLRGLARDAAVKSGREEQARALLGRVREARSAFDPASRRELRDEHAMRVALAAALRPDSNAIDVGANEGATLELITRLAPAGRHIAYEPLPALHAALVERFPTVEVRRAALSDEAGSAEFTHVLDAPAYSGLRERRDLPADAREVERIEVDVQRLDDALDPDHLPALIKIDVEGAELHAMRGAAATIERARPYVLFEHGLGGADLYGSRPGEVFDLLAGAGLRIFDLEGDGPYTRDGFEAVFAEPIWNFLAVPS